jgi:hypothetical protein
MHAHALPLESWHPPFGLFLVGWLLGKLRGAGVSQGNAGSSKAILAGEQFNVAVSIGMHFASNDSFKAQSSRL